MPNLKLKRFIYLYFCNPIVLVQVDVTENHDLRHPHIQYPTKGRSSKFVATVNNQFGLLKIKETWNGAYLWGYVSVSDHFFKLKNNRNRDVKDFYLSDFHLLISRCFSDGTPIEFQSKFFEFFFSQLQKTPNKDEKEGTYSVILEFFNFSCHLQIWRWEWKSIGIVICRKSTPQFSFCVLWLFEWFYINTIMG